MKKRKDHRDATPQDCNRILAKLRFGSEAVRIWFSLLDFPGRTTRWKSFRWRAALLTAYASPMIARQYLFSGRVQGVGFRYQTKQLAKGFDVLGSVCNLPDGRVELQIMGDEEEIDEFIQELHDSPLGHHIQEQEERPLPLLEGVQGFSIREA
jgi:acylphosphatase